MWIRGTLDVNGTSGSLVIFTSKNDDTCGDTITDSSGSPSGGDWEGIYLDGAGGYQRIGEFDYCRIGYGGNASGYADVNAPWTSKLPDT